VSDTRLTALSLKLVIDNWVAKVLIPNQIEEGIIEEVPQAFTVIVLIFQLKRTCKICHTKLFLREEIPYSIRMFLTDC